MKTTYQKPNTTIVIIEMQSLMSTSLDPQGNVNSETVSDSEYNGGTVLGRRGGIWEDEE